MQNTVPEWTNLCVGRDWWLTDWESVWKGSEKDLGVQENSNLYPR